MSWHGCVIEFGACIRLLIMSSSRASPNHLIVDIPFSPARNVHTVPRLTEKKLQSHILPTHWYKYIVLRFREQSIICNSESTCRRIACIGYFQKQPKVWWLMIQLFTNGRIHNFAVHNICSIRSDLSNWTIDQCLCCLGFFTIITVQCAWWAQ
jgi:hypothetical protein